MIKSVSDHGEQAITFSWKLHNYGHGELEHAQAYYTYSQAASTTIINCCTKHEI